MAFIKYISLLTGAGMLLYIIIYNYSFNRALSLESSGSNYILTGVTFSTLFTILYVNYLEMKKKIYLFFMIFSVVLVAFSGAKQAFLNIIITIIVMLFAVRKTKAIYFIVFTIIFGYLLLGTDSFSLLFDRFSDFGEQQSIIIRSNLYQNRWNDFLDNPFFGGYLDRTVWSHNLFLDIVVLFGLFGLVYYLPILI